MSRNDLRWIPWIAGSASVGPSSEPSPSYARPCATIANSAAHCGHPALVPPTVTHPPLIESYTLKPVRGSALYATSGAYVPEITDTPPPLPLHAVSPRCFPFRFTDSVVPPT